MNATVEGVAAPRRRSLLRTVLQGGLALAAVGFVVWVVPFKDRCTSSGCEPGLLTTVAGARIGVIIGAFLAYMASTGVWSLRWRTLLEVAGVKLSFLETWRLTLQAQAGGILLPGGLGGDALRIAYVRERVPQAELGKVIASIFVDRVIGLTTLALVAALSATLSASAGLGVLLWIVAAIPIGAAALFLVLRVIGRQLPPWLDRKIVHRVLDPLLTYANDAGGPRVLLRGMLISLFVSAFQLGVIRLLVLAVRSEPTSEPAVYIGTTFGMIVAALPATPGAWGTADTAYVIFLGRAGVAASAAAAVCMLYRCYWYASGLVGAVLTLGARRS